MFATNAVAENVLTSAIESLQFSQQARFLLVGKTHETEFLSLVETSNDVVVDIENNE